MIKCCLIRHSKTYGNTLNRYIGVTDEPLCQQGIDLLKEIEYPGCEIVFTSTLKRCRETAEIIYPDKKAIIIPKLSECDFGEFENKNYLELKDNKNYQNWIDSNGKMPFPGGESREHFQRRSVEGFLEAVKLCIEMKIENASFIIHGGNIMSIMEKFARPYQEYYSWQVKNGEGFQLILNEEIDTNYQKL